MPGLGLMAKNSISPSDGILQSSRQVVSGFGTVAKTRHRLVNGNLGILIAVEGST
jgi:hypothetical protein